MGELGREIRRLREARGWGQTKLAAAADMAVSGVSQIENGHRNPNSATLIKLARALDVDVADLFPKGQARLPLDDALPLDEAPPLEELHEKAGCETDWLVRDEGNWQAAWPQDPRPREAMQRVRETATEFAKLKPLLFEQERHFRPSHRGLSGPYKQAWRRFFDTPREALARGVAAGVITAEENLDDLERRLGEQPGYYLEPWRRAI
jgi:transcriptional regulator with XRE-family HTH domain